VLDDDAVDCPFCGAPLTGGAAPSRPAAPAKGPAPRTSPEKSTPPRGTAGPAAGSRAARPSEEEPAAPADDDPFGVDPAIAANAIPVSRTPGAGKTIEVTCPMCETKGYVSPKASGKQIKCCNPKCMVPLFTAPVLEKKEVVAPPPARRKKIPWLYILGGLAVAAIVVVCVIVMNDEGPTELGEAIEYEPKSNSESPASTNVNTGAPTETTTGAEQSPDAARNAIVKQALARMLEVSTNIPEQRRPMWRRLAATAYSYGNVPEKARDLLNQLEKSKSQSPWEGIPPLVSMAWRSVKSPDEFQKFTDEAVALSERLPSRGRFATEAAIGVAPLLIVTGKSEAARQLLAKHHSEAPLEQFAAATRIVSEDHSYNFDRTLTGRSLGNWQAPLETAVALTLIAHGRWDEAEKWANETADPVARTEVTIVWAESFLRDHEPAGDTQGLERAIAAGKNLSADGKARLLARLAEVRFNQGDKARAGDLIKQAQELLSSLPPAKPVIVEGIKPLLDLKLEDAIPRKQMALAATEVARAQALSGDARAWENVQLAMRFLSAIGPTLTPTEERRKQVEKDPNRVSAELKRSLGIKKDDEVRQALTKYKLKLSDIEGAAKIRYQAEIFVLRAAIDFGMFKEVWAFLESYDQKPVLERQPLIATFLSPLIAHEFAAAGDRTSSEQVSAATEERVDPNVPEVIRLAVEREFDAGNFTACIDQLNAAINPNGHLHETVLRLVSRLAVKGKIAEAVSFSNGIRDPSLREESLYLTAVLAGRQGKEGEFWKLAKSQNLGPVESCAAAAGLIVGLKLEPAK
jgi:hypothetical protein